jgi:hypothetical protein
MTLSTQRGATEACDHLNTHLSKAILRRMHPHFSYRQDHGGHTGTILDHMLDRLGHSDYTLGRLSCPGRPDGRAVWHIWLLIYRPSHLVDMSAASCNTQLDHQTCRGSSIGRACGSYLNRYSYLKVEGSSPSFGYSYTAAVILFSGVFQCQKTHFWRNLNFGEILEACQVFRGPTPHELRAKLRSTLFFSLSSSLLPPGYVIVLNFACFLAWMKSYICSGCYSKYKTKS